MRLLERVVLGIPYLYLKKIPYAWIAVVAFWTWPPVVSTGFLAIVALGLLLMFLQQYFWEQQITRRYQPDGKPYRLHPRTPLAIQLRNLALLFAGSILVGLLLQGRLRLTGLQWVVLFAGFMILYKDTLLFGHSVVYLVTQGGIGARYTSGHLDYRLFFPYDEIDHVTRVCPGEKVPFGYEVSVLSPLRVPKGSHQEGVLLAPKRMDGFSARIHHVLLTPQDPDEFMRHLPPALIREAALIR